MKNLLIIGASGFIGSNLLKKLANTDIKVIAVSLNMSDFLVKLDAKNIIYEDYETFSNRKEDLKEYIVINLAYTRSNNLKDIEDSIEFTYKVSEKINNLNIKKYIYFSTQSVYNEERKEPARETDKVLPKTIYGEGKVYIEEWLEEFLKENNIKLSILRLASVVGPGMEKRITTRFVDFALNTNKIKVIDSGQVFSFIHINDLVDALMEYIFYIFNNYNNLNDYEIYNIGTEESYSLIDMANIVKEEISKKDKNKGKKIKINIEKVDGEYKNNTINISKFLSIVSWRPKFTLRKIIKEEIEKQYK